MCRGGTRHNGGIELLSQVFRRSIGHGWLLLSGPSPAIEERALERLLEIVNPGQQGLLVGSGEHPPGVVGWSEDLSALLEIEITPVDLTNKQPTEIEEHMQEFEVLIFASDDINQWTDLFSQRILPVLNEVSDKRGWVCWFVGAAALPMGEWIFDSQQKECRVGTHWLPGCLVLDHEGNLEDLAPVQDILRNQPLSYALNLVDGATLALGPAGEVDLWGTPPPSIILGSSWAST